MGRIIFASFLVLLWSGGAGAVDSDSPYSLDSARERETNGPKTRAQANLPAAPAEAQALNIGGGVTLASAGKLGSLIDAYKKIHAIHEHEIHMGNLAKEKGDSARVRRYGARLAIDHEFADRQLRHLAEDRGVDLASPADPAAEAKAEELQRATGPSFDAAFLAAMENGHRQAIALLTGARELLAKDRRLFAQTERLLPILHQHHDVAIAGNQRSAGVQ